MKLTLPLRRSRALPFYYSSDALKYVEHAHDLWQSDRHVLGSSWSGYFDSLNNGNIPQEIPPLHVVSVPTFSDAKDNLTSAVESMYRKFLSDSHFWANINPLDLPKGSPYYRDMYSRNSRRPELSDFGLSPASLFQTVDIKPFGRIQVGDLISRLESVLCGSIGYEFSHVSNRQVIEFFEEEIFNPSPVTAEDRLSYLNVITRACLFEIYLKKTFPTSKRFGLEGLESLVVALDVIKEKCLDEPVDSLVIGMAHRGRLNVICNIMQKPLDIFFAEFRGKNTFGTSEWGNTGDVKYHIGRECSYHRGSRELRLSLLSNPSHLEFVSPVVCGQARARQDSGSSVVPIIVHGDASMSGEGIVYETVQMSSLASYNVDGTIHIAANNQIGFTTYPVEGGSSCYCTDVAKVVNAPVIHVNSGDVEAVAFAASLALKYRQRFRSDVFIDLVGYRLMGHNELDMPKFTNPSLYSEIAKKDPIHVTYSKALVEKGLVEPEVCRDIEASISEEFGAALDGSKLIENLPENASCEIMGSWLGVFNAEPSAAAYGVDEASLRDLIGRLSTLPPDFRPHPSVGKIFKQRLGCLETGLGVDYGLAELLCYALLARDGFRVRLSGQDTQRGTFSHRHALVHDQADFGTFNVFSNVPNGHLISVNNSPLNETAALGFEYGYGLEDPKILPIWEAQFGDFANVAQPVIDEFVCSGEIKWNQPSAITLLLPHGHDGQGPDHSSCRVERFLQLSDDSPLEMAEVQTEEEVERIARNRNMAVVNCSTAANLFHAIMRQMHRPFRKPLIVCSGKKLLKLKQAASALGEFGGRFRRLIPDAEAGPGTEKVVFCSGQIYYDLRERRDSVGAGVALERIEQVAPFPYDLVIKSLEKYKNIKTVIWCQEEPENSGCWNFVQPWFNAVLDRVLPGFKIEYVGARILAAPSAGDAKQHETTQAKIIERAINDN